MICIDYPCDRCKYKRPNIDGWKCVCDAFPQGIPKEHIFEKNIVKLKECNNGMGYDPIEDRPDIQ